MCLYARVSVCPCVCVSMPVCLRASSLPVHPSGIRIPLAWASPHMCLPPPCASPSRLQPTQVCISPACAHPPQQRVPPLPACAPPLSLRTPHPWLSAPPLRVCLRSPPLRVHPPPLPACATPAAWAPRRRGPRPQPPLPERRWRWRRRPRLRLRRGWRGAREGKEPGRERCRPSAHPRRCASPPLPTAPHGVPTNRGRRRPGSSRKARESFFTHTFFFWRRGPWQQKKRQVPGSPAGPRQGQGCSRSRQPGGRRHPPAGMSCALAGPSPTADSCAEAFWERTVASS